MPKQISFQLTPREAADDKAIRQQLAASLACPPGSITGYHIVKRSIDARGRQVRINLTLQAFQDEPFLPRQLPGFDFRDVRSAPSRAVIIGAGPAGLFAALTLLEQGVRPIILERGKEVRARRRDLAQLNRHGILDPDSNYCFGEGGAGTYSDGKLYTRSTKRGDINRILHLLVHFGADERILYESHPHIGTNKLPHIITAMRECIIAQGGEVHFGARVDRFMTDRGTLKSVRTATGDVYEGDAFILATGHSARDIFQLMKTAGLLIEAKPFALGVRIEHPQDLIDSIQYHCPRDIERSPFLPPASYSLVEQVEGSGVFSFCMCPGGIIAPAATSPGELVVNGWSPSKRNNPFANSGMVVQVDVKHAFETLKANQRDDLPAPDPQDPLLLLHFQQMVERDAYRAGGGAFAAPAQRMDDLVRNIPSSTLPACSYQPGLTARPLGEVLPSFIHQALRGGFRAFGKKMRGYLTNEAIVVATESRTSSPVRIPRDTETLAHPQVANLYPCGEGAGYAGGIVSAAMDGEAVARKLAGIRAPPRQALTRDRSSEFPCLYGNKFYIATTNKASTRSRKSYGSQPNHTRMDNILEVSHLKKHFSGQKAVDDISFTISRGSIFGLLGPNGAGKTTLIRMITGIFFPDEGQIMFSGRRFDPEVDTAGIGYMPEERGLYKKMKIGEQAVYLAQLKGLSHAQAVASIKDWFVRLEMESWWNKKVEDLSKGMSQKLQFVTTVLHKPKLIILDEPFSGLDPVNANLIKDEIHRLADEGSTIIFSTHRMEQVEEICDHILLVNKGKKVLDGSVSAVKNEYKENLYRVSFAEKVLPEHTAIHLFDVMDKGEHDLVLKKNPDFSTNDVLQYFMHKGLTVQGFNEILPSLNDIFIRLVEGTPRARQFDQNIN